MPRLILASASPRRRELLLQAGFRFEVQSTDTDETALPREDAVALAVRLARAKALAVAAAAPDAVVLGADTVVVAPSKSTAGGEVLGKPADDADAARMLALLSGATHQVVTGVCVHRSNSPEGGGRTEVAAALTWVTFHTLSKAEIAAYIATGEPAGKAGAYAIQGRAARWIPRIHGDYSNVVGLPLALAADMLAAAEIFPA